VGEQAGQRRRRGYKLTVAGGKALKRQRPLWEGFVDALTGLVDPAARIVDDAIIRPTRPVRSLSGTRTASAFYWYPSPRAPRVRIISAFAVFAEGRAASPL
jgi:hypothetical protein